MTSPILTRRSFIKMASAAWFLPGAFFEHNMTYVPARGKVRFRFAIASDGHYGQPDTDYEADFANLVTWLNAEKKGKGLDLIFINGDIIHDKPEFLPETKASFDQFKAIYYVSRGNHDMISGQGWQDVWGYPPNYDMETKRYAFILADTSNEKGEYLCADGDWLKSRLQHYAGKRYVFVFLHITPDKWTKHGIECPAIKKLLEQTPNVAAIFHGHDHDEDNVKESGSKPYFFDGHFGGNWGTNYKGYRIVEIYKDHSIFTYQCNPLTEPPVNSSQLMADNRKR